MADLPIKELGGKTPLEAAEKPNMDSLARRGTVGLVKTVPNGQRPGSDNANLSVLGYNPLEFYTGRSPLEAVSMGIEIGPGDMTFRCNLVTLSDESGMRYEERTMLDYSADEIETRDAAVLVDFLQDKLFSDKISIRCGVSYRHCVLWKDYFTDDEITEPYKVADKKIGGFLPGNAEIKALMEKSYELLKNHPVNLRRVRSGKRPANSIWLWGQGKNPSLPDFYEKTGKKGAVVSAVDLLKGIAICCGMKVINVDGATGNIHTDFEGKARAAVEALKSGCDFVFVHVEAPDECGHRGEILNKIKSIEYIDSKIVGLMLKELSALGDYSIMILPDHPTPLETRTHSSDPVPFLIFRSGSKKEGAADYSECRAKASDIYIEEGYKLIDIFFEDKCCPDV